MQFRWISFLFLVATLHLLLSSSRAVAQVEEVVSFDCGEDVADRMTHLQLPDGNTQISTVAGTPARCNVDPSVDRHFYFAIDDNVALNGSHPSIDITIEYYDGPAGTLYLQYDSSDPAPFPDNWYKSAGSITLNNTGQWLSRTFVINDAYLGNRENGGADFRIARPDHQSFCIDRVQVTIYEPPPPAEPLPKDFLGATHASGKYSFDSSRDFLNEGAIEIANAGMQVIKVWFIPGNPGGYYMWNSSWPSSFDSLREMADHEYYRELWRRPFQTYILTITGGPTFRDGFPDPYPAELQQDFYELAHFFLTEYEGTGKTFILGTWESDWQLRGTFDLDPAYDPDQTAIDGMIRWYNARQAGVAQARAAVPDSDVNVYAAAEVNKVALAMQGRPTVTNEVLPNVPIDLVSYSAWESVVPAATDEAAGRQLIQDSLAYIASHAVDSTVLDPDGQPFGDKNVFIAEYGYPEQEAGAHGPARLERATRVAVEEAYAFGCPWMVYWEVYCNECCDPDDDPCVGIGGPNPGADPATQNEHCRGFWLKRVDGTYSPAHAYLTSQIGDFITTPHDFDAAVISATTIELTWTDIDDEDNYRLERSEDGGAFLPLATPVQDEILLTDATCQSGRTYRYRLRPEKSGVDEPAWFYSELVDNTVRSDIDRDGDVDSSDFGLLQPCFGSDPAIVIECEPADVNLDGTIDGDDLTDLIDCTAGPGLTPGC